MDALGTVFLHGEDVVLIFAHDEDELALLGHQVRHVFEVSEVELPGLLIKDSKLDLLCFLILLREVNRGAELADVHNLVKIRDIS